MHGYDISDHNSLNPEIGSWDDYLEFVQALRKEGMGHIVDFVPNHMGIFDNPWWTDVLENGRCSPYADFFDIDWEPVKPELRNKVLLPILENQYGEILQSGQLQLGLEEGGFKITYHDHSLPVDPKTATQILEPVLERLSPTLDASDPYLVEMQSITTACRNLPDRDETSTEAINERQREKEVIKRRLSEVVGASRQTKAVLDQELGMLNGTPGENASFDRLHALLEAQGYRLSYWRVASDEINYRRFFDINELVALRMDIPAVFERSHSLLLSLVRNNLIDGIRIDHIDGLMDPAGYLWRLQGACFLEEGLRIALQGSNLKEQETEEMSNLLLGRFQQMREENPENASDAFHYLLVEKILGDKEYLRETWPADGTTGYEFAVAANGVLVERRSARSILNTYRKFTGNTQSFRDVVYGSKSLLMTTSMSAEVNVIAHTLDRISERSRWYRDFTLSSQRDAIREVIACFRVYRSYISAFQEAIDRRDRSVIDSAVAEAKRRNPAISASLFDFIRHTLLLQYPPDMSDEARDEQRYFVMRFQQNSGPVMAKGLEDTAFYVYNPLASLNEVGGNPEKFGTAVAEFHEQNAYRQANLPYSMISTSTHDSKRSEDVRARIDVLSEIPREWRSALRRWGQFNERHRHELNGETVPDRNEEYLLYQTLLGTYPTEDVGKDGYKSFCDRINEYMLKATREAKVHTSWVSPNSDYEEAMSKFISGILDRSPSNEFLTDFGALNKSVAICGMYNSLSQTLLRIYSPGVPDLYQGNEIWNYSLVDPDNRRSVDFPALQRMLRKLVKAWAETDDHGGFAKSLLDNKENGEIKLFVTWRSLGHRRDHTSLFAKGSYVPLEGAGALAEHICAFAWRGDSDTLVVVVPRLCAKLTGKGSVPPTGLSFWGDSRLILPANLGGKTFTNIFTGESFSAGESRHKGSLPLGRIFSVFPVAALEGSAAFG